jgi:hypothetical protein
MSKFEDYANQYKHVNMERSEAAVPGRADEIGEESYAHHSLF